MRQARAPALPPATRVCAVRRRHCRGCAVPGLRCVWRGQKRAVSHGDTARTERRHGLPTRPRPARGRRAPPTRRPPRLGVPVRRSHWPRRSPALLPLAETGSGEPCAQRRGGVSRRAVCTPRVAQAAGPAGPSGRAELSRAGAAAAGNRTAGTVGGPRRNRRGAAGGPAGPRGGSEGTARDGDGAGALRPSARESTAGRAPAPFPALRRAGQAVRAARAVRAAGLERAAGGGG